MKVYRKNHKLVEQVEISMKTRERMLQVTDDLGQEDSYVETCIYDYLHKNLLAKARKSFDPGRNYKLEMCSNPVATTHPDQPLTTIWTLAGYVYLGLAREAEVGEVIHPSVFSAYVEGDELVEDALSGMVFQPYFDNTLMLVMPVLEKAWTVKYFVRVK